MSKLLYAQGKNVVKDILSKNKNLLTACQMHDFPKFYSQKNVKGFDNVIQHINSFKDKDANSIQAIIYIINKINNDKDFNLCTTDLSILDGLYQYSRGAQNKKIKKSAAYKKVLNSPFNREYLHDLEKFGQDVPCSDTFKIFADSNILFDKRGYSIFDLNLKYIKLNSIYQSY